MKTHGGWLSRNPTLAKALAAATALLLVGIWVPGLLSDDLTVPYRYGRGRYFHFHGLAAWLLFAGFVCVGVSVLLAIWWHRRTEPGGKTDQRVAVVMGLSLAGAFIILAMMALKFMGLVGTVRNFVRG